MPRDSQLSGQLEVAPLSRREKLLAFERECRAASYEDESQRERDINEKGEALGFSPEQVDSILTNGIPRLRKPTKRQPIAPSLPSAAPPPIARVKPERPSLVRKATQAEVVPGSLRELQLKFSAGPRIPQLLEGIVPARGAGGIIGPPKCGKTFLAMQLALAVAGGDNAFLGRSVHGGKAIYLALEMSGEELCERLAALLPGTTHWRNDDAFIPIPREGFVFNPDERLAALRELIEKHRPVLVVLDTLARFRKPPSGPMAYENDFHAADELRALGNEFGCFILWAHHSSKKARGDDPSGDAIATHGLGGGSSVMLGLQRASQRTPRAKLIVTGNAVAHQQVPLAWNAEALRWELGEAPRVGRPADKRERAKPWLAELLAAGPMPCKAIYGAAEAEGIGSEDLIKSVKKELGILSKKQGNEWFWSLPQEPSGRKGKS